MKSLIEIRRWATLRCDHCGHRFRWKRDARSSFGNRDGKVYHAPCIAYLIWRRDAEERLEVLGVVAELAGDLDGRTVQGIVEMRAETEGRRIADGQRVWRVFRDLVIAKARNEIGSTP